MKLVSISTTLGVVLLSAGALQAQIVLSTNQNGADAEVRESQPGDPADPDFPTGVNRGDNTEIATRLIDTDPTTGGDRNSSIYLKFDISGVSAADLATNNSAKLRMHLRNNNLGAGRLSADGVDMALDLYGLTNFGLGDWQEDTITYYNAPGVTPDFDIGTKDFNDDLTLLDTFDLPPIGNQNHLPVGMAVDFASDALFSLVSDAVASSQDSLTLVVNHALDGTSPGSTPGGFLNFNYLFIPKEMTELNNDPSYDSDVTDGTDAEGSPFSMADNSLGQFSPKLILEPIPEPASGMLAFLALACLFLLGRRRVR